MSIDFPNIAASALIECLDVCVVFSASIEPAQKSECDFSAKYGSSGSETYIRATYERFRSGEHHLHITLAAGAYFDGEPPQTREEVSDVSDLITEFIGPTANYISARGQFRIAKSKIPADSLALAVCGISTEVEGEEWSLIGGALANVKAPYHRVEWELEGDSVKGKVVSPAFDLAIDPSILTTSLLTVENDVGKVLLATRE